MRLRMRVRIQKNWTDKRACKICGEKVKDAHVLTYYDGSRYQFFHIDCMKEIIDEFYGIS